MAVLAFLVFVLAAFVLISALLLFILNIVKYIIKHRQPRQPWESDDEYQGKVQP